MDSFDVSYLPALDTENDRVAPPPASQTRMRIATTAPAAPAPVSAEADPPRVAGPMPTAERIAAWMPLVHQIVAGSLRKVPANVQRDDLVAAGTFGLIDALRKNGGDDGERFERYAKIRIRGAILDELRAQDWLTRRARANAKKAAGDSGPTTAVVGFEDLTGGQELNVHDPEARSAVDLLEAGEERAGIERAVDKLPERERILVRMHYFQDSPFKDIAAKFGVSEPRISQLHSRAMGRLRTILAEGSAAA